MRRAVLVSLAAILAATVAGALAQEVDGLDLSAIRARAAARAADAERLAAEVERRSAAVRNEAVLLRDRALAKVRALDPKALRAGPAGAIDFDALVEAASGNLQAGRGSAPLVMAFVSLAMPPAALKPLIRDVARAGGVVVFRGFPNNSARAFVAGLSHAVESDAQFASISVDPRLFRAFDVAAVPTLVVASSDFYLCDGLACRTTPPPFDRMVGNVSCDYALTAIADGGGPGAKVAGLALANLRRAAR